MKFISDQAYISNFADIGDSIRGNTLTIEAGARIESFVKILFAGGNENIFIGQNSHVNSGTTLYSGNGIKIGNNVLIAANCTFAPVNHEYSSKEIPINKQGFRPSKGGIVIEDDVWIGAGTVLLDGTTIRTGAVIGAMSLVRGEIPAYSIHSGNPLKLMGYRK